MILAPRRVTFRRWRRFAFSRLSTYRALEYERLAGTRFEGRILDIGGGGVVSYDKLVEATGAVVTVNIDPKIRPSVIADLEGVLPFGDATFDGVLSLSTLEHIRADAPLIREIHRVLKPGGRLVLGVPFLYREHDSPHDFHRHTATWWHGELEAAGFPERSISIEPLVLDPWSSAWSFAEFLPLGWIFRPLFMLAGPLIGLRWRGRERLPERFGSVVAQWSLGWFIEAHKAT